MQNYLYTVGTY